MTHNNRTWQCANRVHPKLTIMQQHDEIAHCGGVEQNDLARLF